jgi:hypothetical protein
MSSNAKVQAVEAAADAVLDFCASDYKSGTAAFNAAFHKFGQEFVELTTKQIMEMIKDSEMGKTRAVIKPVYDEGKNLAKLEFFSGDVPNRCGSGSNIEVKIPATGNGPGKPGPTDKTPVS